MTGFKTRILSRFAATGLALAMALPAWAHHSQAEFDFKKTVEVEGSVTELDWRSPHARLYVDVKDPQGSVVNWNFEMPSPMTLMRRGWKRDSLKAGERVTVKAALARHTPAVGYLITVKDAAGKPLFTGVTQIFEPDDHSSAPK